MGKCVEYEGFETMLGRPIMNVVMIVMPSHANARCYASLLMIRD